MENKLPSFEDMVASLSMPEAPEVEAEDDTEDAAEMEMNSLVLLDILKSVTRIEDRLGRQAVSEPAPIIAPISNQLEGY